MTHTPYATITRTDLYRAIENTSSEFVRHEAKRELYKWAYDADYFTLGDWENCPLDQVGLVTKFEKRSNYDPNENQRFINEASEIDARILSKVKTDIRGEGYILEVQVVD